MKKKIFTAVFAGLSAFALLAVGSSAEGIEIADGGKVIAESKEQGVCAFQFSLDVKADEGAEVSFEFDGGLTVRVAEYRYNEDTGVMNVYVADSDPLFDKSESLIVGEVKGGEASIAEDSFKFVDGALEIRNGAAGAPDEPDKPNVPPDEPNEPDEPNPPDKPADDDSKTEASEPQSLDSEAYASDINAVVSTDLDSKAEQSSETAVDAIGSDNDPGTGLFNEAAPVLITVMFASIVAAAAALAAKRRREK